MLGCYLWGTCLSAGPAPPSQLAAAAGRCLQSGICSGPAEGWLPAPADGQDDGLAVSSIPHVTPTHVGPHRLFLLSSRGFFLLLFVENERLGECTLLSCDSHLQPQALSQVSGMNPKAGIAGED